MSEPFPKHRTLPASADSRGRDGLDAEPGRPDPLAELARLVGREDPFRDLFPAREPRVATRRSDPQGGVEPLDRPPVAFDAGPPAAQTANFRQTTRHLDPFVDEAAPAPGEDHAFHEPLGQDRRTSFRLPALPQSEDYFRSADHGQPVPAADGEAPPLNADLWAQGLPEPVSADPLQFAPADEDEAATGHSIKRTLVVLGAVLALTAGGLGATFLVRGNSGTAASGEPPTILADTGPNKIQPPDTSNQATGGDGNTALLEKSASDNVNNAKVVDTHEQPVDLGQLPKAPPATAPQSDDGRVAVATAPAGTNASAFPQPRKVKTILIRPDGSVIGEGPAPVKLNDGAAGAAPAPSETPAARPATPKSAARVTTTPKTTATPTEGVAAVKPKVVHAAPKPKPAPVQTADAAPDATASTAPASTPGSFAVQLAAPGSEQEAKDVSTRLQRKFASELDGHSTGIFKAEKSGKPVFRVRVSNMTQDDAKALCSKLQAGGGSCFVVRN